MKAKKLPSKLMVCFLVLACISLFAAPVGAGAKALAQNPNPGPWWEVVPEEENPSPYYDSILYSEIAPKLHEIEQNSNRVKIDVIGQSAGGRNLFLATISDPQALGRLGQYQAIRQTMLKDPEKAQEMIDKFGDFKVPVFINASIHGNEYPGVDAAIRLIETLAYGDSQEVHDILDNVILLINVVQNPDGRVNGVRYNENGFDVNRDFITQSQPESRITARIFKEWNPMVVLDLHGFHTPMLIEPCTPPHNPNYEYDLYINWALQEAEAMEAEVADKTGFEATIPYRDFELGWDDWPPTYVPMFGMYHGAYGHTLETPYRDERGVDAHYWASWGMLKFVVEHKADMLHDQIEVFRRGYLDLLQQPIPPELLPAYPQYQDLMIQDFPAAYVIPAGEPFQLSAHQPARLIDFLLYNDVQVEQASQAFTMDGVEYPAGSYIVWLDQPKRGLANTILENGLDLSNIPGLYFYSPPSVWSNPLLWGVSKAVMQEKLDIKTHPVTQADTPQGFAEGGKASAYAYAATSIAAIQATNVLLGRGVTLERSTTAFEDQGRSFAAGTFILPADQDGAVSTANELANSFGLNVFSLKSIPSDATLLREQRIVAYVDAGGQFLLKRFGFDFDTITYRDLNDGVDLTGYDVFINNSVYLNYRRLNDTGRAALQAFFDAGGDYIGLGDYGAILAQEIGAINFSIYFPDGNSIARVDYNTASPISAGFGSQGYVFVNYAAVFPEVDPGVEVIASLQDENFVVSGFWPGWQDSGMGGKPVAITADQGGQDTTLLGFDPTFRAHPEDSFRMVANAIYSGLE